MNREGIVYFKVYLCEPRCGGGSVLEEIGLSDALWRELRTEDKAQLLQVRVRLHDTDLGCSLLPSIVYGKESRLEF